MRYYYKIRAHVVVVVKLFIIFNKKKNTLCFVIESQLWFLCLICVYVLTKLIIYGAIAALLRIICQRYDLALGMDQ